MKKRTLLHLEAGNMIKIAVTGEAETFIATGDVSCNWNESFYTIKVVCELLRNGHVPKKERPELIKHLQTIADKARCLPNTYLTDVISKTAAIIEEDKSD